MRTTFNPANQLVLCSVRPVAAKATCLKCVCLQRPQKQNSLLPKVRRAGSLQQSAQRNRSICYASNEESSSEASEKSKDSPPIEESSKRIKSTIAGLDALLGIEPEEDKEKSPGKDVSSVLLIRISMN